MAGTPGAEKLPEGPDLTVTGDGEGVANNTFAITAVDVNHFGCFKLSEKMVCIDVQVIPDIKYLCTEAKTEFTHEVWNMSGFPIVCRVKGPAKKLSCRTPYFFVQTDERPHYLEITRYAGDLKSLKLTIEIMPAVGPLVEGNKKWPMHPELFFKVNRKPVVRHIRFKAPRPWYNTVRHLMDNVPVSKELAAFCEAEKIKTSADPASLTINEFALLSVAASADFETHLPSFDPKKERIGPDLNPPKENENHPQKA